MSEIKMEWVSEFFKLFEKSRLYTGAAFLTAAIFLFGSRIWPKAIDPISTAWKPWAVVAFLFSGAMLAFWFIDGARKVVAKGGKAVAKFFYSRRISKDEASFILVLGNIEDHFIDLNRLDYGSSPVPRLEIRELTEKLSRKGLVSLNPWSETLVTLTAEGRKRALAITRRGMH